MGRESFKTRSYDSIYNTDSPQIRGLLLTTEPQAPGRRIPLDTAN